MTKRARVAGNADLNAIEMMAVTHYWQAVNPSHFWRIYTRGMERVEITATVESGIETAALYNGNTLVEEIDADWIGDRTKWHAVALWIASRHPVPELDFDPDE